MIPAYNKPVDIYGKLIREARRTWLAKNHIEVADHFFNFCVTCVSLRDWVIKYRRMNSTQKNNYQKEWRAIGYFGACADIANSSKHFGLDFGKNPSVTDISAHMEKVVAIGPNGSVVPGIECSKPFLKITIDNKNEIDLLIILFNSCKDWERQIENLGIADKNMPNIIDAFIENI